MPIHLLTLWNMRNLQISLIITSRNGRRIPFAKTIHYNLHKRFNRIITKERYSSSSPKLQLRLHLLTFINLFEGYLHLKISAIKSIIRDTLKIIVRVRVTLFPCIFQTLQIKLPALFKSTRSLLFERLQSRESDPIKFSPFLPDEGEMNVEIKLNGKTEEWRERPFGLQKWGFKEELSRLIFLPVKLNLCPPIFSRNCSDNSVFL